MSRIRVLHVIGGGELGGAEVHILNLLTQLDQERFQPRLCCLFPEPLAQVAREKGIPTDTVVMKHKLNIGIIQDLMALIREHEIDIVHTHGVRANLVGRMAARLVGVQHIVTTVHSILAQDYPDFVARQVNLMMERMTVKSVERFITVSDLLKKDLIGNGIPASKISTIYNGVNLGAFNRLMVTEDLRTSLGISRDTPLIGIIARFHPVKGHRYFLEAALDIIKVRPDCRFLVVGSGQGQMEIEGLVRELGLREYVIFTGYRQDVVNVLNSLDLLVISSLSEGFGLTAIEAMAMEVPVVATRVGGLPEFIRDGENGLLVSPADGKAIADAALGLLAAPERGQILAEQALKMVRDNFSLEIMVKKTETLYTSLVEGR